MGPLDPERQHVLASSLHVHRLLVPVVVPENVVEDVIQTCSYPKVENEQIEMWIRRMENVHQQLVRSRDCENDQPEAVGVLKNQQWPEHEWMRVANVSSHYQCAEKRKCLTDAPEAAHVPAVKVVSDALLHLNQLMEEAEVKDDNVMLEKVRASVRALIEGAKTNLSEVLDAEDVLGEGDQDDDQLEEGEQLDEVTISQPYLNAQGCPFVIDADPATHRLRSQLRLLQRISIGLHT
ncbi:hypothetical protein PMAYCL1PPCAC_14550 [Pristionchus mayeri]|uniref:Uncharacterized protein n=1 Tax=Pristionchus mayeri TaxID=1317129 RepID=A0AAN4ZVH4_9BILA|nr:hypothetical protein PMAYCL1PPCAC_14550 [Pristionchus mayeri]